MAKRANGEGTLSRRKDKTGKTIGWRAAVVVGYRVDGTEDRRWVSGKTQSDVQEKLRGLQVDVHTGMVADTQGMTVASFLDQWIEHKQRDTVRPNTLRSYRDTVRLNITPYLGRKKLDKLRPLDIEHMLTQLSQAKKSAALSAYAVRILKMALRQGVHWQMIPRNVAEAIRPPKVERKDINVWTEQQVVTFLNFTARHRLNALFYLALMTGMRRGELLGLHWADIDWERSRLKVRHNLIEIRSEGIPGKKHAGKSTVSSVKAGLHDPKTKASRRTIPLSPGTMAALKAHQAQQNVDREKAAEVWSPQDLVFTSEIGDLINPRALYDTFKSLAVLAGVPSIRFHDLRHTAASLMIRRGLSAKTVSDRLGHADVAFTLRIYAHLYEDQKEEAAFDVMGLQPRSADGPPETSCDTVVTIQPK